MNIQEVERLLKKYYEGLTSLQEEQRLSELLLHEELPDAFESDKQLILQLKQMKHPREFTQTGFEKPYQSSNFKTFYKRYAAMAAVLLALLVFAGVLYMQEPAEKQYATEENGAYRNHQAISMEEAKSEALKAVMLFGTAIETGEKEVQKFGRFKSKDED